MQIVSVIQTGKDYEYKWPSSETEKYPSWIEYKAILEDGAQIVRIGFGLRRVYSQKRIRVVVWINGNPEAEFLGADDFEVSGEVLSEIKLKGKVGEKMCRYRVDAIPERYAMFTTAGLATRVDSKGVRNAWAVVANVSDHKAMAALAALRRLERS